ncbi:type II toxin-antitoxin system RelE/ParE family toxin [Cronbergia sp. UHCC 0137]|uniref:type II toxin-antitoxin system RelE/ParE family toxin n=1 Tax=Cronbergia sp. UHCC 0137 TaxID=3110239 RepID=UPI002B20302D|nr:type II toxin-antitoxin system RelE/ParE family toxin [Cronbergia sp. UHCC 0137]MEA5617260.1 type II toxin-antitoxin system RelE/ParE family toxin [Cronbergia sp. UHCC 0137]
MVTQIKRFNAVKTARVDSLSALKCLSFPLTARSYDIVSVVQLLEEKGTQLPFPYSSDVKGAKNSHLRELRIQSRGKPIRVFYAFDPRRVAILLIGGDKTGDKRFYEKYIPIADRLYEEYLQEISREGLI